MMFLCLFLFIGSYVLIPAVITNTEVEMRLVTAESKLSVQYCFISAVKFFLFSSKFFNLNY